MAGRICERLRDERGVPFQPVLPGVRSDAILGECTLAQIRRIKAKLPSDDAMPGREQTHEAEVS